MIWRFFVFNARVQLLALMIRLQCPCSSPVWPVRKAIEQRWVRATYAQHSRGMDGPNRRPPTLATFPRAISRRRGLQTARQTTVGRSPANAQSVRGRDLPIGRDIRHPRGAALARATDQQTLAIANVAGSTMLREASAAMPLGAGPELAIPATKSFTCQLTALYLLALYEAKQLELLTTLRLRAGSPSCRPCPPGSEPNSTPGVSRPPPSLGNTQTPPRSSTSGAECTMRWPGKAASQRGGKYQCGPCLVELGHKTVASHFRTVVSAEIDRIAVIFALVCIRRWKVGRPCDAADVGLAGRVDGNPVHEFAVTIVSRAAQIGGIHQRSAGGVQLGNEPGPGLVGYLVVRSLEGPRSDGKVNGKGEAGDISVSPAASTAMARAKSPP